MSLDAADRTERPPGLKIATVGGVPVYIGRTWPLIALVVIVSLGPLVARGRPQLGATAYLIAAAFAVLLALSVLAHEAAHAVVAHRFGYLVSRVVVDLWGGHTAYDSSGSDDVDHESPGRSALVAVAGPLANGLLAVIALKVVHPQLTADVPNLLVQAIGWTNGFVAVFNLLPGLPLDGGFLVESLVWRVTGSRETGLIAAGWCGRVVTGLVLAYVLVLPFLQGSRPSLWNLAWAAFIGTFLWAGATGAIRTGKARRLLASITIASVWRSATTLSDQASVADAVELGVGAHGTAAVVVSALQRDPVGLVDLEAVDAIPPGVRATTPLTAVMRRQAAGWVVDADPGESITTCVERMQELALSTIAVRLPDGRIGGVIVAGDLYSAV